MNNAILDQNVYQPVPGEEEQPSVKAREYELDPECLLDEIQPGSHAFASVLTMQPDRFFQNAVELFRKAYEKEGGGDLLANLCLQDIAKSISITQRIRVSECFDVDTCCFFLSVATSRSYQWWETQLCHPWSENISETKRDSVQLFETVLDLTQCSETWQTVSDGSRQVRVVSPHVFQVRSYTWCRTERGWWEVPGLVPWHIGFYMHKGGFILLETGEVIHPKDLDFGRVEDPNVDKKDADVQCMYLRSHICHQVVGSLVSATGQLEYFAATIMDAKTNGRLVLRDPVRALFGTARITNINTTTSVRLRWLTPPGCNIVWNPRRHAERRVQDVFGHLPMVVGHVREEGRRDQKSDDQPELLQVVNVFYRSQPGEAWSFGNVYFSGSGANLRIATENEIEDQVRFHHVNYWKDLVCTCPGSWLQLVTDYEAWDDKHFTSAQQKPWSPDEKEHSIEKKTQ